MITSITAAVALILRVTAAGAIEAASSSIPRPDIFDPNFLVVNDEFVASVYFGLPHTTADRVESFMIEWGPIDEDFPFTIRGNQPEFQMQVLEDGIEYVGRLFNVGKSEDGKSIIKSLSSEWFYFRSDSTRVNSLRSTSNSFFDDFNGGASDYDERRWNVASDVCGDSETANFNINKQKHVHTTLGSRSELCVAERISAKARGVFDFTGRKGTINIDVDGGEFDGHIFLLDVGPELGDLGNFRQEQDLLRIQLESSILNVVIRRNGKSISVVKKVNLADFGRALSVPNVRKPWVIQVSKDSISININDVQVLDNVTFRKPLKFQKADIRITQQLKNSLSTGHHVVVFHLDNFGFDGPPQSRQILSYRNALEKVWKQGSSDWVISIPDDKNIKSPGRRDVLLKFTRTLDSPVEGDEVLEPGSGLGRRATEIDFVAFNGLAIKTPLRLAGIGDREPEQVALVIPQHLLKEVNRITVKTTAFIGNVHIEFDFACSNAKERPFTVQPSQCVHEGSGFPMSFRCDAKRLARPNIFVHGIVNFKPSKSGIILLPRPGRPGFIATAKLDMFTGRQLRHNGGSQGLKTLDVLSNCNNIIKSVDLGGDAFEIRNFLVDFFVDIEKTRDIWYRVTDNDGRSSTLGVEDNKEEYTPFTLAFGSALRGPAECPAAFTGGDCEDICVPTEGISSLSVC